MTTGFVVTPGRQFLSLENWRYGERRQFLQGLRLRQGLGSSSSLIRAQCRFGSGDLQVRICEFPGWHGSAS